MAEPKGDFDWFRTKPMWLRAIMVPLILPFILVSFVIANVFIWGGILMAVIFAPLCYVLGRLQNNRFWRDMKARGIVADWSETASKIDAGRGTLVIELDISGQPWIAWWFDVIRDRLDPQRVALSWHDYAPEPVRAFERDEPLARWSIENVLPRAASAKAVRVTTKMIESLSEQARREAVFVILDFSEGSVVAATANDLLVRARLVNA